MESPKVRAGQIVKGKDKRNLMFDLLKYIRTAMLQRRQSKLELVRPHNKIKATSFCQQ